MRDRANAGPPPPRPETSQSLPVRLAWFAALWLAGVATLALAGFLLRSLLR
jgi:hypothetical protein